MKKALLVVIALVFASTTVFAADFAPTVLKISAPAAVQYDFDGSTLEIPVTIAGTPANTILCVYTKDQAATMPLIRNGYLGWHTVNKVDTSVYISDAKPLDIGANTITWDGKDDDGNAVATGAYTYYIWGYDNATEKYAATTVVNYNSWNMSIIDTDLTTGNALTNPAVYTTGGTVPEGMRGRSKWTIGGDPEDTTLLETTYYPTAGETTQMANSPYGSDLFWVTKYDTDTSIIKVTYYQWIPGGECVLQSEWGSDGIFSYESPGVDGWDLGLNQTLYVGNDVLVATRGSHYGNATEAEVILIDAEAGEELTRLDVAPWWVRLEDGEAGAQQSGGPNRLDYEQGVLFMGSHASCMNTAINPHAGEDVEDFLVWVNDNGDYVGDHNFEEDAERPWVCHDYNVGPYKYRIQTDANMFSAFPSFDMGAVSFGLLGPDGTGIDYFAYSGETAGGKRGTDFVHVGSAFDGIYVDNHSSTGGWDGPAGIFFVGQDSVNGIISTALAVEEDAAAFAVAQNSPNPFNPTTTINFSTVEAGNVSIDVFNVAGQKVDTIANEFMNSGSHSVVWDASGFSAGIYFYTVKSGDITKTMKMTLLK